MTDEARGVELEGCTVLGTVVGVVEVVEAVGAVVVAVVSARSLTLDWASSAAWVSGLLSSSRSSQGAPFNGVSEERSPFLTALPQAPPGDITAPCPGAARRRSSAGRGVLGGMRPDPPNPPGIKLAQRTQQLCCKTHPSRVRSPPICTGPGRCTHTELCCGSPCRHRSAACPCAEGPAVWEPLPPGAVRWHRAALAERPGRLPDRSGEERQAAAHGAKDAGATPCRKSPVSCWQRGAAPAQPCSSQPGPGEAARQEGVPAQGTQDPGQPS